MSRHLVDPELSVGLDTHLPATLSAETLAQYRSMLFDMVAAIPKPTSDAIRAVRLEERCIPGPDGVPDVRVLIYTSAERAAAPLPAILYMHGGGFVSGNAEMSDPNSRAYVAETDCVVVSVDDRLAPETPFPGPVEDCHAALRWLQSAAAEFGVDPARIAIAGESAGGGLVAALCLLVRDRGGLQPSFQHLAEPMLDRRGVASDHPHAGHFGWTRDHNRFGWSSMLGDAGVAVSPYASPALADDLAGLPPTYIHIGAIDAHVSREARRVALTALKRALHGR